MVLACRSHLIGPPTADRPHWDQRALAVMVRGKEKNRSWFYTEAKHILNWFWKFKCLMTPDPFFCVRLIIFWYKLFCLDFLKCKQMQLSSINSISNRHSGRLKSSRRRCCRSMHGGPPTSSSSPNRFRPPLHFGANPWRYRVFRYRP